MSRSELSADTVVVGGGLVGSAVAYELVREGVDVVLVERQDLGQATYAGAGILSPGTSRWGTEEDNAFAHNAAAYYDRLIPGLTEDGGGNTGYGRVNVMVVAGPGDKRQDFDELKAGLAHRAARLGKPEPKEIPPDEALGNFPPLGETVGALLDHGARVDGRKLRGALQRAARGRGLRLLRDGVDRILVEKSKAVGVVVREGTISCQSVVLATGAWLSPFLQALDLPQCVAPMRGQICHLRWDAGPTDSWAVVSGMRGHYILPWGSGRVVVGATREQGSGLITDLTAGGCHEVLGEALRLAPGLASAVIQEWRVGLRPVSNDDAPLLGRVPALQGCYLATGHGAGGLLLGPWSAHLVAHEVLTGKEDERIARYAPSRLSESKAPDSDQDALSN